MSYLVEIHLSPVQTFIKGARRTRDLKFNSTFLSKLASVAASRIMELDSEALLIFPALPALHAGDVSNKVLVSTSLSPDVLTEEVKKRLIRRSRRSGGKWSGVSASHFIKEMPGDKSMIWLNIPGPPWNLLRSMAPTIRPVAS